MQGRRLGFNFDVAPSLQEPCVFYFGGNRQDEGMTEYKGKSGKAEVQKCGKAEMSAEKRKCGNMESKE